MLASKKFLRSVRLHIQSALGVLATFALLLETVVGCLQTLARNLCVLRCSQVLSPFHNSVPIYRIDAMTVGLSSTADSKCIECFSNLRTSA